MEAQEVKIELYSENGPANSNHYYRLYYRHLGDTVTLNERRVLCVFLC